MRDIPITPESTREIQERAFQKNSVNLRKQCNNLPSKLTKYIVKLIKKGYKDPYEIYLGISKKSLDKRDIVRIVKESLAPLESDWYVAFRIEPLQEWQADIYLKGFFTHADQYIVVTISENPITGSYHYISSKIDDLCNCPEPQSCKRCSICDDNHVKAAVYPCGHASYCWECANKLEGKCGICRSNIFEIKNVNIS